MAQLSPRSFLLGYNPAATTGYYAGFHDFFGLPIDPRGNIIGVLIAAWACARIEGMVRRFMPDDLDMLLTSLITLLDRRYAGLPDHYAAGRLAV